MNAYQGHITSNCWEILREEARHTTEQCEFCGMFASQYKEITGQDLDVHHLTYERFGHERLEDLVCVCRNCHNMLHGISNTEPIRQARREWALRYCKTKRDAALELLFIGASIAGSGILRMQRLCDEIQKAA